ncbi:MAG TPA: glycosyltransferase family 4 protein [bacterium]|nr:glycosyltransferase family 4 protein [bacterium]
MKKLAVVDMLFRWPPDGGARVDVMETVSRLARSFHVKLFVPQIHCVIDRGRLEESVSFEVESIPFTRREFTGPLLEKRFRKALASFNPDVVFLTDGFHLKPWIARAIRDYPYFLKFYAYENLCLRFNGTFMRGDRYCYRSGAGAPIQDRLYCCACGLKSALTTRSFTQGDFLLEFLRARAWLPGYWSRVRDMLDRAKAIVVYNHMLKNLLEIRGWRSVVIPAGFNPERFPLQPPRVPDGTVRLGALGRLRDEQKGIVTAVRTMTELRRRGIPAELHVTGTPDDNPLALPGVVYRGWFTQSELPRFFGSVDVVLVPSVWQEPFGIVTLEAMCSGRPVVASRVAGPVEIIQHGVNGLLAAPLSATDMADKVVRLLDHPEATRNMISAAHAMVLEKYPWDTVVETHYLPLILSILGMTEER